MAINSNTPIKKKEKETKTKGILPPKNKNKK